MSKLTYQPRERKPRRSEAEEGLLTAQTIAQLGFDENAAEELPVLDVQGKLPENTIGWVEIDTVRPMGDGVNSTDRTPRTQPRKHFDPVKLQALADDIAENGQQIPATVRFIGWRNNKREWGIIKGERRWKASKKAKQTMFLVRIVQAKDRLAYRMAVLDDIHNVSHLPAERGASIAQMQADMIEELNEFIAKRNIDNTKALTPKKLEQMEMEGVFLPDGDEKVPSWIHRVFERAAKVSRTAKVQIEDLSVMVGLTERMIHNYLSQAGLSPKILEKVYELGLSGTHITALASLKEFPLQEKLLAAVVKENLNGPDTMERAGQMKAAEVAAPKPATVSLKPLRALVTRAEKYAQMDVPNEAPEEVLQEGRAMVAQLETMVAQLKEKWG